MNNYLFQEREMTMAERDILKVNEKYMTETVIKAVDILNLIARKSTTATEICQELNLNKSTAHRLLYTLEYANMIEKDAENRSYRVGIKLVELCSLRLNDVELKTEAKPYLQNLARQINQAVHLAIYEAGKAVFIDKFDVANSIRMYSGIGKTIPIHCSAIGKALIMMHSDNEIADIIREYGMEVYTPFTLRTPEALLAQIHEARINGYTIDNCEHEDTICCLAVPIFDYRNNIIASISTAAHKPLNIDQTRLIALLKQTSKDISGAIGYVR